MRRKTEQRLWDQLEGRYKGFCVYKPEIRRIRGPVVFAHGR